MFKALLIEKQEGAPRISLTELADEQLPEGDVTVRVLYSTINYKDALAITGRSPVVRQFPMVPGIDFAGVVETSSNPGYQSGDRVLLNGWGLGESHWGGLAEKARVKADWLPPLPSAMTEYQAMSIGTAGYTSMLCLMALERHGITPQRGKVLVTGATGGVGSFAISLLANRGYSVIAATGKQHEVEYLKRLGAESVIDREELSAPGRALGKEQWAAAIDSVGSHTLANVCAGTAAEGAVAACGLAQGMDFPATVAPFILRGVSLLGVNSVTQPYDRRVEAWRRLCEELDSAKLLDISREISLEDAVTISEDLLNGKIRGRLVVNVTQ